MPGADGSHGTSALIYTDCRYVGYITLRSCCKCPTHATLPRGDTERGGKLPTRPKQFALRLPAATNKNHVELNGGSAVIAWRIGGNHW